MDPISVEDAAKRLDVSPRRVRQLVEDGKLKAARIGRSWVIDSDSVEERVRSPLPAGRPYSSLNSWNMASLADAIVRDDFGQLHLIEVKNSLESASRWHASRKLRNLLAHGNLDIILQLLRERADRIEYRFVHPSLLERLAREKRLLISGGRGAQAAGDLFSEDLLDAYISDQDLGDLESEFHLMDVEEDRANVVFRIFEERRPVDALQHAPILFLAADLAERGHPRAREASERLFEVLRQAAEDALP